MPEDVSVVGFDDTPESAYFVPALTTIRQDFGEVGRRCVDLLLSSWTVRPSNDTSWSRPSWSYVRARRPRRPELRDSIPRPSE